jgi:small subunit ribosomal protein S13
MAELKQLVRIANADMDGNKPILHQLTRVKGVGKNFANMICALIGLDRQKKAGELSEEEAARIEKVLGNVGEFGAPVWMLNRRKDPETGKDMHVIGNDLRFIQDNDVKLMKKIRSYKGVRHSLGQPVRGQRTKSNFRRNKGKVVGYSKSKGKPAESKKE